MQLNLRMLIQAISIIILINVFLSFAVGLTTLWTVEQSAAALMVDTQRGSGFEQNAAREGFTRITGHDQKLERPPWSIVGQFTPLKDYEVKRSFQLDQAGQLSNDLFALNYVLNFYTEDLVLSYPLGNELLKYKSLAFALLVFEGFILLTGILKNSRKIKHILRPLTDVALDAQKLASGGTIPMEEMKNLRKLAGTISSIDATKLDKRLPIDGQKNELKDLASAINSMLDRIDEAYQAQVRFVSDASHELRTPISVIQGYANLLDRWGKNDPSALQESIDAIKSEAESIKDLIEQLLFLARGDNETLQLYTETFDSFAMVEEILHETQMIDPLHTFRIKGSGIAEIHADRQLMKQAIRILVDNSIKYTPEQGEIVVSVSKESDLVCISVQDNGIGIDPESLPYIFDRFYRSDESRARRTGGSGLGLSIMKWIIDRHGGAIEVISRKDIGTRTTVKLPGLKLANF